MAIFVHITERCANEAMHYSRLNDLEDLQENIESIQDFNFYLESIGGSFFKRAIRRKHKLLAYRMRIDDDDMVVFLHLFPAGSHEYGKFSDQCRHDSRKLEANYPELAEDTLGEFLAQRLVEEPPVRMPSPSEEESDWLYQIFARSNEDFSDDEYFFILETQEWVTSVSSSSGRESLETYWRLLQDIVLNKIEPASPEKLYTVHRDVQTQKGIVYHYRSDLRRLILLEALTTGGDISENTRAHLKSLSLDISEEVLSAHAMRSYPNLMVLDLDAWKLIEKDEEANLALSPEEAQLLDSIRQSGLQNELGFPLFINGRAGSGKSTMLQYLAYEYLDYTITTGNTLNLIYMTCSPSLLERARKIVRGLLKSHYRRVAEKPHDERAVELALDRSFVVFHEFLWSLLPEEDQEELVPSKFINYAEFRRRWDRSFAKRPESKKISVDVAWHAIRSFIKGMRTPGGDLLSPEHFEALPKKRRSISVEAYKFVFERVWESWYLPECETEGLWDDQDLATRILDSNVLKNVKYAAVFCDEAQDFTSNELEIIFQLSVFSMRSLQPQELSRVPFIFAGDPLQTINPTGFQWDAVKADFHDRFVAVLDPRQRASVDIRYEELNYNYRSNPGIVRFCNTILLLRAALLKSTTVKPQKPWSVATEVPPFIFSREAAITKQQIQQHPEWYKLIDCEEGEESSFSKSDAILSELSVGTEGVYPNVFVPITVKGLEHPVVVLHRFSEKAPNRLVTLMLSSGSDAEIDEQDRLTIEYFLNRLYVAASRAKGRLFVVDHEAEYDRFWRFATDPILLDKLHKRVSNVQDWEPATDTAGNKERLTTGLVKGPDGDWDGQPIDRYQQAKDLEEEGARSRNAYLMWQSALNYRSVRREFEADRCLARAAEFENNLLEAGDKYQQIQLFEDAFRCYWSAEAFKRLIQLVELRPEYTNKIESSAAAFMDGDTIASKTFVSRIAAATTDMQWIDTTKKDMTWRKVFERLTERVAAGATNLSGEEAYRLLLVMSSSGIPVSDKNLATAAFNAERYEDAIVIWERQGAVNSDDYRKAKALSSSFPNNLRWYDKLGDHESVLRLWEAQTQKPSLRELEPEDCAALARAFLELGDLNAALSAVSISPEKAIIAQLARRAIDLKNNDVALETALVAVRFLVKSQLWREVVRLAEERDLSAIPEVGKQSERTLLSSRRAKPRLIKALIRELAVSQEFSSSRADSKAVITKFLERTFLQKQDKSKDWGIPPEVVGAAIERDGKFVNALQFYENIMNNASATDSLKRFAVRRRIVNLRRAAEHAKDEAERNPLKREGKLNEVRQRESLEETLRKQYNVRNEDLTEYPIVSDMEFFTKAEEEPSVKITTAPSKKMSGPLMIVFPTIQRMRIVHTETGDRVEIDAQTVEANGDLEIQIAEGKDNLIKAWKVPSWGIIVRLFDDESGLRFVCDHLGQRFEYSIDQ